jgi:hypothetical protein
MRLGDVTRAERMFQLTQKKDLFTYTVMMNSYTIFFQTTKISSFVLV